MPQTTNARAIITSALQLIGVLDPLESPSSADLQTGLRLLNGMVSSWRTERLVTWATNRHTFALVANQQTYTIGLGGTVNVDRPNWLPAAGLILTNQTPNIEVPLEILTVKDWTLTGIKALQSTQPVRLYYDYGQPQTGASAGLGALTFWPVPQIAYSVALYLPAMLSEFADASTDYVFGDGYVIALEYNLAVLLARPNGREAPGDTAEMARRFKAQIKRANVRQSDLSVDPALRANPGALYNWRVDSVH